MKGKWLMVRMGYAISAWLWWSTSTFGSSLVLPISLNQYPLLSFSTIEATNETYHRFILGLRDHLINPEDTRHGIPVMRNNASVRMADRFILVELENYYNEHVTLAISVVDAYVVGYRAQNEAYFLRPDNDFDARANSYLFTDLPDHRRYTLAFKGTYGNLERYSPVTRARVELGLQPLHEAIDSFYHFSSGRFEPSTIARSFLVCIQMISEAARFHAIEHEISEIIVQGDATPLSASGISLENEWDPISTRVQTANPGGVFSSQIELQRHDGSTYYAGYVWIVRCIIAFMKYKCQPPPPSYSQFPMLIKPVVFHYKDGVCENAEPTVRITGPNGLCVEVENGYYGYGNKIQLSQCISSFEVRQFWTLKGDGTIQSNGKCLSTSGDQPGDHVEIINCFVDIGRIKWQVWDNGTIINSKTGLAMTAIKGNVGQMLTVEPNDYTTSQSWLPSNETQPFVTSIIGLNYLCLETNGRNIWLEKCVIGVPEQAWALYGDGSIRPRDNRHRCITSHIDDLENYTVKVFVCSHTFPAQRWIFKNDNALWNLHYDMVMEVKDSDPNLEQIVFSPFNGDPSQQWFLML